MCFDVYDSWQERSWMFFLQKSNFKNIFEVTWTIFLTIHKWWRTVCVNVCHMYLCRGGICVYYLLFNSWMTQSVLFFSSFFIALSRNHHESWSWRQNVTRTISFWNLAFKNGFKITLYLSFYKMKLRYRNLLTFLTNHLKW